MEMKHWAFGLEREAIHAQQYISRAALFLLTVSSHLDVFFLITAEYLELTEDFFRN